MTGLVILINPYNVSAGTVSTYTYQNATLMNVTELNIYTPELSILNYVLGISLLLAGAFGVWLSVLLLQDDNNNVNDEE